MPPPPTRRQFCSQEGGGSPGLSGQELQADRVAGRQSARVLLQSDWRTSSQVFGPAEGRIGEPEKSLSRAEAADLQRPKVAGCPFDGLAKDALSAVAITSIK